MEYLNLNRMQLVENRTCGKAVAQSAQRGRKGAKEEERKKAALWGQPSLFNVVNRFVRGGWPFLCGASGAAVHVASLQPTDDGSKQDRGARALPEWSDR